MSPVREVVLGGRRVRWRVEGSGPPLVCVHGLAASARWWNPIVPALARTHELHLVDLPRFSALARFRPGDAADWLVRWLEAAGIERPALMGHSLGGLLAAEVATRRELDRLVLVAPVGLPTRRSFVRETLELVASGRQTPRFLPSIVRDAIRCGPENVLRGGFYARAADLSPTLAGVAAPTLLVWGDRDRLVPFALAESWREAIPDAYLFVVEGAGHIPMVQSPVRVAAALLEFLDEPGDLPGMREVDGMTAARDDGELGVR
jgi:pimeloyl-ACP methyl ester carboxylesterase